MAVVEAVSCPATGCIIEERAVAGLTLGRLGSHFHCVFAMAVLYKHAFPLEGGHVLAALHKQVVVLAGPCVALRVQNGLDRLVDRARATLDFLLSAEEELAEGFVVQPRLVFEVQVHRTHHHNHRQD